MTARPDGLVLEVEATDPAKLQRVQDIVAGHLERFGARAGLAVVWDSTTGWVDAGVRISDDFYPESWMRALQKGCSTHLARRFGKDAARGIDPIVKCWLKN